MTGVELAVVAPKTGTARCRIRGTDQKITFRSGRCGMPSAEILTVTASKQRRYTRHRYLSGNLEDRRIDVKALGLVPLRLGGQWPWDPAEEYSAD